MCTINKKKVNWTIGSTFMNKIKKSLKYDTDEIAGVLLFKDTVCKAGTCNKKSTKFLIKRGNGSSVYTPNGIINFHTHPNSCYESENAVYGWPSGEDISQVMRFAKKGNMIHIVFSKEGAYVIKVNKILNTTDTRILERIFKMTHVYRSRNQAKQKTDFRKKFLISGTRTVDMWLKLINGLTPYKLHKLNNLFRNKKRERYSVLSSKLSRGKRRLNQTFRDTKLFEVKLIPMGKTLTFAANFIEEGCHAKSFGESQQ